MMALDACSTADQPECLDLEKQGLKPFSIQRVIPGDESTAMFALKIVAQTRISICS